MSTDCFSQSFVAEAGQQFSDENGDEKKDIRLDVTTQGIRGATNPNRISFLMPDGSGDTNSIEYLMTEDTFSFALKGLPGGTDDWKTANTFVVTFDRSPGVMRFASRVTKWGNTVTGLLTGQFGDDGAILGIDSQDVQILRFGYPTGQGNDATHSDNSEFSVTLLSAKGDNANGLDYNLYYYTCRSQTSTESGFEWDQVTVTGNDCTDISNGTFILKSEYCEARGSDSYEVPATTFTAADVPYFATGSSFNGYYASEGTTASGLDLEELQSFMESPELFCFSEVTKTVNPNAS